MKNFVILFLTIGTLACTPETDKKPTAEGPSNIIFLIGDGMGISAVSTCFYFGDEPSPFARFRNIGLIKTSSATHKVTDSAASGTAMASGIMTNNGAIGVDTMKIPHTNIAEVVSTLGWSTGIIATSSITHATPASFYAHVERRGMQDDIAVQLLDSEIDFFAGGGIQFFHQRSDGKNLFQKATDQGFILDTTSLLEQGTLTANNKYGFILADNGLPPVLEGRGDFLPSATSLAIEYLSGNTDGFFLMVEASQIDWAGHGNDTEYLLSEMSDFEDAIALALDFAEKDGNTLVVVTADHETGGFALSGAKNKTTGRSDYRYIEPAFATSGHTATLIPVFAYGPGAEEFMGIYENTEIFHKMTALISFD